MLSAMARDVASGAEKAVLRSGELVSTTAITFSGSQKKYGWPMRSCALSSGIGRRCGGRSVP